MTNPVFLQKSAARLVLASGSKTRQDLLKSAGLRFEVLPSSIDEDAVKTVFESTRDQLSKDPAFKRSGSEDLARILAEAKAVEVSERRPGCFVLGCDQTLEFEGQSLSKAPDLDVLRRQLLVMRGKTHTLHSCAVLAVDSDVLWSETTSAQMHVRDFTPEFLGHYIALAGNSVLNSVGGYQLEGLGIHLFEKIEGDHFTILGLPLMAILSTLRDFDILEH